MIGRKVTWFRIRLPSCIAILIILTYYLVSNKGVTLFYTPTKSDVIQLEGTKVALATQLVVSGNRVPRWKTFLIGQQRQKKKFVKKLMNNNKDGKDWENSLPNDDCNTTMFMNKFTSRLKGGNIYNRRVAIASFPGSGNTWLRHLFHVTTGIWTGSVYFDPKLYHGGFPGEACSCNDSMTFGLKVHDIEHARAVGCTFDDVILVLRSPYSSIMSEFNRRKGQGHTGVASVDDYKSKDWNNYASKKIYQFKSLMPGWLNLCNDFSHEGNPACMIINYEDIKGNPRGEIKRVLTHLGLPLGRLRCLEGKEMVSGPFHRNHKADDVTRSERTSPPLCMLNKPIRELLYDVIKNTSASMQVLKNGNRYVKELNHDLPNC